MDIRTKLAAAILLSAAAIGQADPAPATRPSDDQKAGKDLVKVITYNVQFLPGIARMMNRRSEPEYRAKTIGRELTGYDIIGLNEVFDDEHRGLLLAELQRAWPDAYHVVLSPEPPGPRFNGGLAIVSRLPFIETNATIYSKCSTPDKHGFKADGFAAKGVLHARIRRSTDAGDSDFVDVFATHLESQDQQVRDVQYQEFADFVAEHAAADRPTLMMGDFNTRGNPEYQQNPDSKYHLLLSTLRKARPTVVDLWPTLHGNAIGGTSIQETSDRGRRIDYVFLANPSRSAVKLTPLNVRVNGFLDPRVVALSDHSAVEADFRWERPE